MEEVLNHFGQTLHQLTGSIPDVWIAQLISDQLQRQEA
jgi:hypothetical protein